jgi:cation:H+ antiporter
MDLALSVVLLAVGAGALYFGSKWLVDGAVALALRNGVRPLVIGLTIVALGTSLPEAVLAVVSSLEGTNAISLGNVIGANISNGALVLGVACLMGPVALKLSSLRRESFYLLLSGPLLAVLAYDGGLGFADGAIMLLVLLAFFYTLYTSTCRGETCGVVAEEIERVEDVRPMSGPLIAILIITGTAVLAVGAQAVVEGASGIAMAAGVSSEVVGLTLVAIGTSVPEMTIAVTASRKGQSEVVLGNVVGTIIINTLFILGLGAIVGGYDTSGPETAAGIGFMIALSTAIVMLLAVLDRGGKRIGAALLVAYAGYIAAIVLLFG